MCPLIPILLRKKKGLRLQSLLSVTKTQGIIHAPPYCADTLAVCLRPKT